jgi:hypothetical protein
MSRLKAIAADRDRTIISQRQAELEAVAADEDSFAATGEDAESTETEATE